MMPEHDRKFLTAERMIPLQSAPCKALRVLATVCSFLSIFLFSSCFKEDPLSPPDGTGLGRTAVIEMGSDYEPQIFYSLTENKVVSQNSRFAYDLLFDADASHCNVWLNTAKFMCVVETISSDLLNVSLADTVGKPWQYERGMMVRDSNAIGKWWSDSTSTYPLSRGKVYIVNLGVNTSGEPLGFVKMKLSNSDLAGYHLSFCDINSTVVYNSTIVKDASRNYVCFTFSNQGQTVSIEPEKSTWDLCFTRYTHIFYNPYYLPYQVTGVLQNPSRVSAYVDSTVSYSTMQIANFSTSLLRSERDAIGYNWKHFSSASANGEYTVDTSYIYFIKVDEAGFYKLRFLDFFKAGVKGYPTFEYEGL